jgi:hypothetical protein
MVFLVRKLRKSASVHSNCETALADDSASKPVTVGRCHHLEDAAKRVAFVEQANQREGGIRFTADIAAQEESVSS